LIGAVLEEFGWRGYALTRMLAHRSALTSALLIGIPWGILHIGLPLPGQMNAGTSWVATVLFLVGLSVILTWLFIQTQYGIVIGIVFHTGQNFFVFFNGGIALGENLWLLAIVTVIVAIILVIFFGTSLQRVPVKKLAMADAE
jgi:membrane protease YdiL (CAAX protease family)